MNQDTISTRRATASTAIAPRLSSPSRAWTTRHPAARRRALPLGAAGTAEAFVPAADDIAGITSSNRLAKRLTLADDDGRTIPVGTCGGAREYVLPNYSLNGLQNVTTRIVP